MRRAVLTFAIATGLVIGAALPVTAIGETQVTLNCSDGTSTSLVVDADNLAGLTEAVQAMVTHPAGLTCTLVQNPLGVVIGRVALASPGQRLFIVVGGRWQVTCASLGLDNEGGSVADGVVARVPGSWSSGFGLPQTRVQDTDSLAWVNIVVNVHQHDDGTFFGTLNETIPANQPCPLGTTSESHFTSKPVCFTTDLLDPTRAYVRSHVTQTSGALFPRAALGTEITFTFKDNGNPSRATDKLQGPPEFELSVCETRTGEDPDFLLLHGNISVHQ